MHSTISQLYRPFVFWRTADELPTIKEEAVVVCDETVMVYDITPEPREEAPNDDETRRKKEEPEKMEAAAEKKRRADAGHVFGKYTEVTGRRMGPPSWSADTPTAFVRGSELPPLAHPRDFEQPPRYMRRNAITAVLHERGMLIITERARMEMQSRDWSRDSRLARAAQRRSSP